MNKKILRLAIPNIISNLTVPLLGLVDMAIVGHLGAQSYIGAIALGTMFFNIIYWNFGFLRMGTSGFTAQAYGRRRFDESVQVLVRALSVGLLIALFLVLFQFPLLRTILYFVNGGEEVEHLASVYFYVGIWGAPAVLCLYGFKGWYIGMQNSRFPMYIAITLNCVNIVCSLFFVYVLKWRIYGVAAGTVIAQYFGLFMAITLWFLYYRRFMKWIRWKESLKWNEMKLFFSVNRDIFLRTICLVVVTSFFTSAGAGMGDVTLAVNTLLMQLFTLFSYFMDGFAFAAEALTGRYIGAQNRKSLRHSISLVFLWGVLLSLLFTVIYSVGGKAFLSLLTDDTEILQRAGDYFYWVLSVPLIGFSAFLWDGIYVGATSSKEMRSTMFIATTSFFIVYYSLHAVWTNHALWIAFLTYLAVRGIMLTIWSKKYIFEKIHSAV